MRSPLKSKFWRSPLIPTSFSAIAPQIGFVVIGDRARGNSYPVAMRSLALKWIRVLFRCWKNLEADDEAKYVAALKREKPPIAKLLSK